MDRLSIASPPDLLPATCGRRGRQGRGGPDLARDEGVTPASRRTPNRPPEHPRLERWRRMMDAVGRVTDRLGKPVDPGIREAVAALNLVGLATVQSCEGHVNDGGHGLPAPWVDFARADEGGDPGDRARALLDEFYAPGRRQVAADLRLRYEDFRLSNGGSFEALDAVRRRLAGGGVAPVEMRALRRSLAARRAEMDRFARFLRARAWLGAPRDETPRAARFREGPREDGRAPATCAPASPAGRGSPPDVRSD